MINVIRKMEHVDISAVKRFRVLDLKSKEFIYEDDGYGDEYQNLVEMINEEIQRGWQPYGSPFVKGNKVCQAMVKYECCNKDSREMGKL